MAKSSILTLPVKRTFKYFAIPF